MMGQRKLGSRIARWATAMTYYDLVLVLLPIPFLVGLFAGVTLSIPLHVGVVAAATLSALILADAVFRNPPTGGRTA